MAEHALGDLSQDKGGLWWWACACGVTCDDAVLTALQAANDYLDHRAQATTHSVVDSPPRRVVRCPPPTEEN